MLDVELICRKSPWLDDWYVIERAEHDGREWFEPTRDGLSLMASARIGNADVEGTLSEMIEIAKAIKIGGCVEFRRCAAETAADGVLLYSPRNSRHRTLVPRARALALADQILSLPPRRRSREPRFRARRPPR